MPPPSRPDKFHLRFICGKAATGHIGMTPKRGDFVKPKNLMTAFAASAAILFLSASAADAQRPPPTPDQRLERLERQMQQVQRQLFPKGRPAETAGFSDEPAATQSSVLTLNQRLDSLERQVADMLRQTEENGNRLQSLQGDLGKMRSDQEQRISTLEQRMNDAASGVPAAVVPGALEAGPAVPPPKAKPQKPIAETASAGAAVSTEPAGDPGEDAYTAGFRLWEAGQFDAAITALRAFTSAYPKHRRASYANNLVGRALLDKGQPRAAAEALLANYRNNPTGERAPDSLFYLGQALMKLGQPGQACKAYAELDAVYGAKIRADLKKLESDAKAQAQCS
jgi:TolA-binding protein